MQKGIHESVTFGQNAVVGADVRIGKGTKVWHFVNLYGCQIGENCVISSFSEIGRDVRIGNNCKIECRVFIPTGVEIEDDVFVGPSVTFTNDKYPKAKGEWKVYKTIIQDDVSIGASCTILCGVIIRKGACIGAGSVITKNVGQNELWYGHYAIKKGEAY